MIVTITPIKNLQLDKVHFHSVRIGDNPERPSEFKDFYNRMKLTTKNLNDFNELREFMQQVGVIYGAIDSKFKPEGSAERLNQPIEIIEVENDKDGDNDYGLRLYCLRIGPNNVILFNGDRKTVANDVMKCENCRPYFLRANSLATLINDALINEDIYIENTFEIKTKQGFVLNVEDYGQRQH